MARPRRTPQQRAEDGFRAEVSGCMGYAGIRSQRALARETGIPQATFSRRMESPEGLTVAELRRIVETLRPDPKVILKLIGYDNGV